MVLPVQTLSAVSRGASPMFLNLPEENIQPASFDLTLGDVAYGMRSAALPYNQSVEEFIARWKRYDFSLKKNQTNVLERGVCYIIPLKEEMRLPPDFRAIFSPKSSTGRCDVFVRVLTDNFPHYDRTPYGYHGKLYLEVVPLSFNIKVSAGLALTQARIKRKEERTYAPHEISTLHARCGLLYDKDGQPISNDLLRVEGNSVFFSIDLDREIVGFEARPTPTEELDLTLSGKHRPSDFWTPIGKPRNGEFALTPGTFYLLATKERSKIPMECCGEMMPYDVSSGEVRPHYAGFFDPGFGGDQGTTGVLEVRCRDVPFRLVHGQPICRMVFEPMDELPSVGYSGHYAKDSRPSLSKHFENRYDVWGS